MNIITSQRTYATPQNAEKALAKALAKADLNLGAVRYFIATSAYDSTRYVPTLVGAHHAQFAHVGIMVVA